MRRADIFHSFAQEHIAEWAKNDAEKDQRKGFELQAPRMMVMVGQRSSWAS